MGKIYKGVLHWFCIMAKLEEFRQFREVDNLIANQTLKNLDWVTLKILKIKENNDNERICYVLGSKIPLQ